MALPLSVVLDPTDVLATSIETDRRYFELGAVIEDLGGAQLAWMPGLSTSPAAVAVHRVRPDAVVDADGWIDAIEGRLRELRAPLARIYLDERGTKLDEALDRRGYSSRDELALAGREVNAAPGTSRLRTIALGADWDEKLRFHDEAGERPDGHDTSTVDWVAMERAKCASGGMEAFFLERDGHVVGAIGAVRIQNMLRMKNVMTHPAHRRTGVGQAMIAHLAQRAVDEGRWGVCIFAVAGDTGEKLYRSTGLEVVGRQVEWSKPILGSGLA